MEVKRKEISPVPIKENLITPGSIDEGGSKGTVEHIRFLDELRKTINSMNNEIATLKKDRAGIIFDHAGDTAPDGSIACDGQELSKDEYPILFDAIGYTWGGSGDTFKLPDQTYLTYGVYKRGRTGDVGVGTYQGSTVKNHDHSIDHVHDEFDSEDAGGHDHDFDALYMSNSEVDPGGSWTINEDHTKTFTTTYEPDHHHAIKIPAFVGRTTVNGSKEGRPISIVTLMCIWTGE